MIVCPECSEVVKENVDECSGCGWKAMNIGNVKDFLNNTQRSDQTEQDYNKNYEKLAEKNIIQSNIDRAFLKKQAENLAEYIGPFNDKNVCEIGVGQGFLCDIILSQSPQKFCAVDVAISYLKNLENRNNLNLFLANAETLPFKNEFDVVVSTDVMEHVLNVGSFLYCVNRSLKIRGRTAIRVPYKEGLLNYSPHKGYGHQFGHMRSFNKEILEIYFEQAGFKVISFNLDGYSPYMPGKWASKSNIGKSLIVALHQYVNKKMNHWSEVSDLPRIIKRILLKPVEIVVVAEKIKDA